MARRRDGETARRRFRSQFVQPPDSAGRWSLVRSRVLGTPSATDRLAARAEQLLHRYGVLTREAVAAEVRATQEGTRGGFGAVYPVLRAMEEAGQIRRGYFVAGLGATQFALPAAVDRLRALRETRRQGDREGASLLAATDPANPYGAALPWPEREDGRRPSRAAGAIVILVEGTLAAWMGRGERGLLTFPDAAPHLDEVVVAGLVARVLAGEVESGRRDAVFIREVNGEPATRTPMGRALIAAGFVYGPQGYMKRA